MKKMLRKYGLRLLLVISILAIGTGVAIAQGLPARLLQNGSYILCSHHWR